MKLYFFEIINDVEILNFYIKHFEYHNDLFDSKAYKYSHEESPENLPFFQRLHFKTVKPEPISELYYLYGHLLSDSKVKLKALDEEDFSNFYLSTFISKFFLFLAISSVLIIFLLYKLTFLNVIGFNADDPITLLRVAYFWFATLSTTGYGDFTLKQADWFASTVSILIVIFPILFFTLLLTSFGLAFSFKVDAFKDKSKKTIYRTLEYFHNRIQDERYQPFLLKENSRDINLSIELVNKKLDEVSVYISLPPIKKFDLDMKI